MKCDIETDKGPCPLCRKDKEKLLFVLKSEVYNGKLCGEHLHSLVPQKPLAAEPKVHEFG